MIEIPEETLQWMRTYMDALRSTTDSLDVERQRILDCIDHAVEDMGIAKALVDAMDSAEDKDDDDMMLQAFRERVLMNSAAHAMFQMMLVVWDHQQETGMPLQGGDLSKFNNLRGGGDVTSN